VAEQVVWVKGAAGAGSPQSVMFPGSLTLGDWRIRGNESGAFYLEVFDDSGAVVTNNWFPVCTWGFNTENNSPSLTVGGVDVVQSLSNREPLFTAVDPVYKNLNLETGAYELKVHPPFWCAGRVNGLTPAVVSSIGRVAYTVHRPSGFAVGVYEIRFASPAPNNDYVVNLTQQGTGTVKIWENSTYIPTTSGFHVVCYNTTWQLTNSEFHFSVVA
jgi:hypothetical protein